MVAIDQSELSKIIADLLRIAKVAMPPKLYAEDPRVVLASALLGEINATAPTARAPTVPRPAGFRTSTLDVRPVEQSASGLSCVIDLPGDLAEAVAKAQGDGLPLPWSDAMNVMARDWLTTNRYLQLPSHW
jgi:hypothetical protein